ncbi:hypothetical protein KI387_007548, partial [Taxus chinensis]
ANLGTLALDQELAVSVEDDLIMSGKLRRDTSKSKSAASSSSTPGPNTDPLVQKLANDLLAIKKQLAQHAPLCRRSEEKFSAQESFAYSSNKIST